MQDQVPQRRQAVLLFWQVQQEAVDQLFWQERMEGDQADQSF